MKRNLVLAFWIFGILFPMGWFIRVSPLGYRLFNDLFSPQWMHIFMHSLLFGVLGALLMFNFYGRMSVRNAAAVVLALVLAVAVAQEGIQLISERLPVHGDNFFDIGVDMSGGIVGAALALGVRKLFDRRGRQLLTTTE
ncbi:MAG: hypothetical protein OXF55_19890 [Caldilineaceae bacterium]|nr:hypothetical protein [Caldilineaceae bacterium]